jgi:outer membrane autotransporter protein
MGRSTNTLDTDGGIQGGFNTNRLLAQAKVLGSYAIERVQVQPYVSWAHTQDRQKAYNDSLGHVIGSQTVKLNQVAAGLNVKVPMPVAVGKLDWVGGASLVHSSVTQDGSSKEKLDYEGTRTRVEFGVNYEIQAGSKLRVRLARDGLGTDNPSSTISGQFDYKF